MKTLLLKLSGPLQSWGTSSHFETRQTDLYPSKSAIVGLLASSMGIRRDETAKLTKLNELNFAVRIDQPGNLHRDYHTAKKYKNNGDLERTYVTNRYYLEDAVFIVALSHQNIELMDKIENALHNPYFQLFMGRRALPLPYDFILEAKDKPIIDALKTLEWQAQEWYRRNNGNKVEVYADADLLQAVPRNYRQDRVKSFSQKDRKFGFRGEARIEIYAPHPKEKEIEAHDAFGAI